MIKTIKIKHGGYREGAGRKSKSGIPGGISQVMRIPESDTEVVRSLIAARKALRMISNKAKLLQLKDQPSQIHIPQYGFRVRAGFPSPADDYVEGTLDLNELLIKNIPSTFFLEVQGLSMINAGIFEGDTLIVDRSIEPKHGDIVVAVIDGEHTVKRLYKRGGKIELRAEIENFPPVQIKDGQELQIFGVVTSSIHQFKR